MPSALPAIPAKRYFTIGEVAELCEVKPHVLRYWEQEFAQLKPMKRRGNRRYYQHHEVLMVRRIRELLYERGLSINEARSALRDATRPSNRQLLFAAADSGEGVSIAKGSPWVALAVELQRIRDLLAGDELLAEAPQALSGYTGGLFPDSSVGRATDC